MVIAFIWVVTIMYFIVFAANIVAVSTPGGQPNPAQMVVSVALVIWGGLILMKMHGVVL